MSERSVWKYSDIETKVISNIIFFIIGKMVKSIPCKLLYMYMLSDGLYPETSRPIKSS